MFQDFANYLIENAGLNPEEIKQIEQFTLIKKLRKRQYLLQEGHVAHYNSFVVKGCLRLFSVGENGTEHNLRFAVENWWINDYESYNSEKPSKLNIEALEDSELILITKKNWDSLHSTIPGLHHLKEKWENKCSEASQNRILTAISGTAEEKYDWFIKTNPQFFNRIPLHMVASYLGMSRETLSRVRQQYVK